MGEAEGAICDKNSGAVHRNEAVCSCSCPAKDIFIFKGGLVFFFAFKIP